MHLPKQKKSILYSLQSVPSSSSDSSKKVRATPFLKGKKSLPPYLPAFSLPTFLFQTDYFFTNLVKNFILLGGFFILEFFPSGSTNSPLPFLHHWVLQSILELGFLLPLN